MTPTPSLLRRTPLALAALLAFAALAPAVAPTGAASAQTVRGYVPPDELVSFPATTPMSQFFRLVNPTFVRVTGKRVVDPMDRTDPIGVALNGVHFIDAFELVLDRAGLDFSESENYFVVTEPHIVATTTDGVTGSPIGAAPVPVVDPMAGLPATAQTREIRIDAVIFELNSRRAREVGTNWAALFGQAASSAGGTGGSGGSTGGTGTDGEGTGQTRFYLNAGSFFDALDGFLEVSSDQIDLATVLNLFRYFETEGYGQTIAAPSVTVQSGVQGQMQSGQDIPINLRDFQGNTITSFVQTGIIIDVTPTLIVDERGETPVEFVHMTVKVEKSSGVPTADGIAIAKSNVNTQIPLLSGEMRAIGGLTTTDESFTRRGVPILKDIPILNFFFSYKQKTVVQNELVVVLRARLLDSLPERLAQPLEDDVLQRERDDYRERMDRFNPGAGQRSDLPPPVDPIRLPNQPVRDVRPLGDAQ